MESKGRPFLDFYGSLNSIPTRQSIESPETYREQREFLFRNLGVPLSWLAGRDVFELGPGDGRKTAFLLPYAPRSYVAVDGNPASIEATQRALACTSFRTTVELHERDFLEFDDGRQFDLVLAEAVIPTQAEPGSLLAKLVNLARPGGVIVFTCMDSLSLLAEMLRRAIASHVVDRSASLDRRTQALVEFFSPDIRALPGMTRLPQDWVVDQMLHPWTGPLLDMASALEALGDRVDFLGSSPRFVDDWRWYKSPNALLSSTQVARDAFWSQAHNLLDYRVLGRPRSMTSNRSLYASSNAIYEAVMSSPEAPLSTLADYAETVMRHLPDSFRPTMESIRSFQSFVESGEPDDLSLMRAWWGRGQQYVSVVRK